MPLEAVECQACRRLHKIGSDEFYSINGSIYPGYKNVDGNILAPMVESEGEESQIIVCAKAPCVLNLFGLADGIGDEILEAIDRPVPAGATKIVMDKEPRTEKSDG